jgi:hypothetical protein
MARAAPRDVIASIEGKDYIQLRRLLRDGRADPDAPVLGTSPLSVAVERGDLSAVALLLHWNASPESRAASGAPNGLELATRMREGNHADVATPAGRRALRGGQCRDAERILTLLRAPQGEDVRLLVWALEKKLDAEEMSQQQQQQNRIIVGALLVCLLLILWAFGYVARLGARDGKEL